MGVWSASHGVEKDQQLLRDLQRSLNPDKLETLLAGEREVALLINESNTPITKGVAILVGETGYSPVSQHSLAPLSSLLNNYGWVTMVMMAPNSGFFADPEAEQAASETTEQPPPSQPETVHPLEGLEMLEQPAFDRHEQELMMQLEAVVQRTRQYPGFFLVIAQGTSAAWLTKLYSEKRLQLADALVVLSPYWPDREYNNQLPELMARSELPVLDVYSPWANEWSRETRQERKVAATKGLKMHYRQRELIGQAMDNEQFHLLSKEIYGWLTHMGW